MTGGVIGGGLNAKEGLLAVLFGNLFLVIIACLVGIIGYRTGLTTYNVARIVFGKKGSVVTSLLLGILAMGFIGVLLNSFGLALHSLVPSIPVWAAILGFTVCITISAIHGFKGLQVLSSIAAPSMWIFLGVGLIITVNNIGGFSNLFEISPKGSIPFSTAVGSAIATWITGAALVCDITRYARKESDVIIGSIIGYIGGAAVFEGASVLTTIGVGNPNMVEMMATLGLLIPGILLLALALWTTTDNNVYSTALAFTNAGDILNINLSKPVWTIIAVSIALVTSLMGLATKFSVWLNLIGTLTPPFAGIIIAHFWIVNAGKENYDVTETWRPSAFIAWFASAIIAKYQTFTTPAIVGLISVIIIYPILVKLMDSKVKNVA